MAILDSIKSKASGVVDKAKSLAISLNQKIVAHNLSNSTVDKVTASAVAKKFAGQTNLLDNPEWRKIPLNIRKAAYEQMTAPNILGGSTVRSFQGGVNEGRIGGTGMTSSNARWIDVAPSQNVQQRPMDMSKEDFAQYEAEQKAIAKEKGRKYGMELSEKDRQRAETQKLKDERFIDGAYIPEKPKKGDFSDSIATPIREHYKRNGIIGQSLRDIHDFQAGVLKSLASNLDSMITGSVMAGQKFARLVTPKKYDEVSYATVGHLLNTYQWRQERFEPTNTAQKVGSGVAPFALWGGIAGMSEKFIASRISSSIANTVNKRVVASVISDLIPFGIINAAQENADNDFQTSSWLTNTLTQALAGATLQKVLTRAPRKIKESWGDDGVESYYNKLSSTVNKLKERGFTDEQIIAKVKKDGGSPGIRQLLGQNETRLREPDTFRSRRPRDTFLSGARDTPSDPFIRNERGFITSLKEEFGDLAGLEGTYVVKSNKRLMIKAKNLVRDDIASAEKIAKTQSTDEAYAIGEELSKHYFRLRDITPDKFLKESYEDKIAEIGNAMARNATNTAQALQALSLLKKMTPEGQLRFAARTIQKYNEEVVRTKGGLFGLRKQIPEITGKQAAEISDEMRAIQKMPEGDEKAIRFSQLQDKIAMLVPGKNIDKALTLWRAGLLTSPRTHLLNMGSNLVHGSMEIAKDIPAAGFDRLFEFATGKRSMAFTMKGLTGGVREGLEKGWMFLRTGYDTRNIADKFDYKKVNMGSGKFAKTLQTYETTIFRLLGSEDQPFYYGAKARSIYDQALAAGKNSKLKGKELDKFVDDLIKNPSDDMLTAAVLDAETAVFQNTTALGTLARNIQQSSSLGKIAVPFSKTPSAVAMQIINYSPVGAVKAVIENMGKGKFNQRQLSQALGRSTVGIAPLYMGYQLVKNGLVALEYPTSQKERDLWEAEGRKENTILVDGKWVSPRTLGPGGNLIIIGAYFGRAFESSGSPTTAMIDALLSSAESLTDQTFAANLGDMINAISDPKRDGMNYVRGLAGSVVPALINDIAKASDPLERRVNTVLKRVQSRIPGLRNLLEPKVDLQGREVKRPGSIIDTFFNPTAPSQDLSDENTREIRRLFDTGDENIRRNLPDKLGDNKGFDYLTDEENTELWRNVGLKSERNMTELINDPQYQAMSDEEKAAKIGEFYKRSKDSAKIALFGSLTLSEREELASREGAEEYAMLDPLNDAQLMELYDIGYAPENPPLEVKFSGKTGTADDPFRFTTAAGQIFANIYADMMDTEGWDTLSGDKKLELINQARNKAVKINEYNALGIDPEKVDRFTERYKRFSLDRFKIAINNDISSGTLSDNEAQAVIDSREEYLKSLDDDPSRGLVEKRVEKALD